MATEENVEQVAEVPETPVDGAPEAPADGADAEGAEAPQDGAKEGLDALPEWAQKEVKRGRNDAANYRKQLREAQEALAAAKSPEDFQAVTDQLVEAQKQLLIRDHTEGLPKALVTAEWVAWPTDEDGIKKVAEGLRQLVAEQATSGAKTGGDPELRGGLNPNRTGDAEKLDPAYWAKNIRRVR